MGISNVIDNRGLIPLTDRSGDVSHVNAVHCFVASGRASSLCIGDLVMSTAAQGMGVTPLDGASGLADPMLVNSGRYQGVDLWTGTNDVFGVVVGFEYDPERGKAGQKYLKTTDSAVAIVRRADDLGEYMIRANAAVIDAAVGANFGITARSVNTMFGTPGFQLDVASLATTNTLPLRLVGIAQLPGNDPTIANCAVRVRINTPDVYGRTGY